MLSIQVTQHDVVAFPRSFGNDDLCRLEEASWPPVDAGECVSVLEAYRHGHYTRARWVGDWGIHSPRWDVTADEDGSSTATPLFFVVSVDVVAPKCYPRSGLEEGFCQGHEARVVLCQEHLELSRLGDVVYHKVSSVLHNTGSTSANQQLDSVTRAPG